MAKAKAIVVDTEKCAAMVNGRQCSRKPGHGPGNRFCKQHGKQQIPSEPSDNALSLMEPQVPIGDLLSIAVNKGLPVEQIRELLDMRRELKAEWARERFFEALSLFQADCPVIVKTREVLNKDDSRRFMYAPIDEIQQKVGPLLRKHGLSYTLDTVQPEDLTWVRGICCAHHMAGHSEKTEITIPMDPDMHANYPQKVIAAMSYTKRITFCNAFGILTSDPDTDGEDLGEPGTDDSDQPKQKPKPKAKRRGSGLKSKSLDQLLDVALALRSRQPYASKPDLAYKMEQNAIRLHKTGNKDALIPLIESMDRIVKRHAQEA